MPILQECEKHKELYRSNVDGQVKLPTNYEIEGMVLEHYKLDISNGIDERSLKFKFYLEFLNGAQWIVKQLRKMDDFC